MKLAMDIMWKMWEIGTKMYDYYHVSDMEERINSLEDNLTSAMENRYHTLEQILVVYGYVLQFIISVLVILISYIIFRQH